MNKKYKYNFLPISFVIMIISFITINIYIKNHFNFTLAEMNLFLTVSKFVEICNKFSRDNLHSYFILATSYDIIWPISYCSFFFFMNFKINRENKYFNLFNIFIILLFFFDMLENITTLQYIQSTNQLYIIPSVVFTNIKWLLFLIIITYLVIGLIKFLRTNSFLQLITNKK